MDYAVTVCDPLGEYRHSWAVEGVKFVSDMPDDVVTAMKPDSRCAGVALTHDPKLDDLALLESLRSEAFYVGALGSRLNNQRRRDRLTLHFGLSESELARLHGPAGLYIGSKNFAEIAISILAEVTAVKNGVGLASTARTGEGKALASQPMTGEVCASATTA